MRLASGSGPNARTTYCARLVEPLLPGDPWAQKDFLYWLSVA